MNLCKTGLAAGLFTLGLACVGISTAGCSPDYEDGGIYPDSNIECGGLADSSDRTAPKSIKSNILNSFSLDFNEEGLHVRSEKVAEYFPVGRYSLQAQRQGEIAHFRLSCDRRETTAPLVFEKDLDISTLDELHALLMEQNVPAVNGSSLRNSALGTFIDFNALYDSGETLSLYAEGGASTVPPGWCGTDVFVSFFLDKLDAKGKLGAPLYSIAYAISNEETGYLHEMELKSDGRLSSGQALFCSRLCQGNGQEEKRQEFPVPRAKLEEAERLTDAYGMRGWKKLPFSEETALDADFVSIAMNYTQGEEAVCVDNEMELPEGGWEGLKALQKFMDELESTAQAGTVAP